MPAETNLHSQIPNSRDLSTKSAWVSMRRGKFRWDIEKSLAEEWLDENGELPIARWMAEGIAKIVKTGPHRTVYRLGLPLGVFYLKHYRTPDWQAVLQNLVRPCKADLEWRAAHQVALLGLNTFETVAIGRQRRHGVVMDNFLISREIPDVEPLDDYVLHGFPILAPKQRQNVRKEIARQLGEMTARLHRGGLLHRDLHPGNVLIQERSNRPQLFLIDLHALSQKRNLSPRRIAFNLSLLNNFFARLTSISDRCRFLHAYAEVWNRGGVKGSLFNRETLRLVDRICQAELHKADLRGDKKWQRGNRRLIIWETPPNRCRGLAGLGRKQLQSFRIKPESLFGEPHRIAWQIQKPSLQRAVIELTLDGKPQRAIATAFRRAGLARNAWEMGHALVRRRLSAPRPLLFVEPESGDWNYLVVEELPNAVSLQQRLQEQHARLPKPEWERWLKELMTAMAVELRKLHDHGFHQPNLSQSSLVIENETGGLRVGFVSLEHLKQTRRVDSQDVMDSLANCALCLQRGGGISSSHGVRFLRVYLGSRFSSEWKTYWRGTLALALVSDHKEAA